MSGHWPRIHTKKKRVKEERDLGTFPDYKAKVKLMAAAVSKFCFPQERKETEIKD